MSSLEAVPWTLHKHCDDLPWINTGVPGLDWRIVHCIPDQDMVASQIRAEPFTASGTHRHLGPAHAFTTKGMWGHDHTYEYRPGSYIYEPIGVTHQFLSGPERVEAFFVTYGKTEFCDPDTDDVIGAMDAAMALGSFYKACEELGLARPNILGQ